MNDINSNEINPVAHSDLGCMLFAFDNTSSKYKYLVPVKSAPATGSAPAQIEVTEMDSPRKQYILDRQETPAFEFDYNYTIKNYAKCKECFDGKTERRYLITYGDKSGVEFTAVGATWRDALAPGGSITGKISAAVSKIDDVSDCTSIIDISSIPEGKASPFVAAVFTVTFDANGGTGETPEAMTCANGAFITLPDSSLALSGDDFNCWNTKADGTGENLAVGQKFYATANTTLYAKY